MKFVKSLFITISLVCLFELQLYADTFVYLPNNSDTGDSITIIKSSDDEETVDDEVSKTEFGDTYSDKGPYYGVAVVPGDSSSFALVTVYGSDQVIKITNDFFTDDDDDSQDPSVTYDLDPGNQKSNSMGPRGIAVTQDGSYAYVANYDDNSVSKINLGTANTSDAVDSETINTGNNPWGIAVYYDEYEDINYVYVANYTDNTVTVITDDDGDFEIEDEDEDIEVEENPLGIAVTPDGKYVYVANESSGSVSVIQTSDKTVVKTIDVGDTAYGVAVGSDGQKVYATNQYGTLNRVAVINTSSQLVIDQYKVSCTPMGVSAPKNGDRAYAVCKCEDTNDTVSVINISDDTLEEYNAMKDAEILSDSDAGEILIENVVAVGVFIGGTKPEAPSDLDTKVLSPRCIDLTWDDNSSDELGFKIERRKESEQTYTPVAKVDEDTTFYRDGGLEDDTVFYYRVRAYNEAEDSSYSYEKSATTQKDDFSWCFIGSLFD
ncbi:MAG: beta-propeller fold lactonase family protein [Desulfobacteraceae bacterium]|nr:beta-propeller fold lactonase family protein [Desulfobacteraceae bacterium]